MQAKNQLVYFVSGMWCSTCAKSVREIANNTEGVEFAEINYSSKLLFIELKNNQDTEKLDQQISTKIAQIGFAAKRQTQGWIQSFEKDLAAEGEKYLSWVRVSLVWFFAMWSGMIAFAGYLGSGLTAQESYYLFLASAAFGIPAIVIGIIPYIRSGVRALVYSKILTLDFMIAVGGISAIAVSILSLATRSSHSYADSGAMILAILLLTKKIENEVTKKITSKTLFQIQNDNIDVQVLKQDKWVPATTAQIRRDQVVKFRKNETISFDGILMSASAQVNTYLLTGENHVVSLSYHSEILAGTLAESDLEMKVSQPQGLRMIDSWAESALLSHNKNSTFNKIVLNTEKYLVVFALSGALLLAVLSFLKHSAANEIFESFFIGILVFCPCLFASILPLARQFAFQTLGRIGVHAYNSDALIDLPRKKNFYFDKTGTLLSVQSEIQIFENAQFDLSLLSELAAKSPHPILKGLSLPFFSTIERIQKIEEVVGEGVKASTVTGESLLVGKLEFILKNTPVSTAFIDPAFPVVAFNGKLIGQILVKSIYDVESKAYLEKLRQSRPDARISILSGDPNLSAAQDFKNINYYGGLSPSQKAEKIASDSIFVGDGLNDTLALAKADISFRLGNRVQGFAPVDFQIPAAKMQSVWQTIKYAKRYRNVVWQTLGLAFIYNILALSLAIAGIFSPLGAVLAMSFSFLLLLASSLRLVKGV